MCCFSFVFLIDWGGLAMYPHKQQPALTKQDINVFLLPNKTHTAQTNKKQSPISFSNDEAFRLTVIETMAINTPLVATNARGIPRY
jgi:glycosyltransferase involved in cell wall biosynthesis